MQGSKSIERGLTVALSRFSAIGDVAMTIPAVYNLCAAYPDVNFIFLTRRKMADLFVNPPANLTIEGIHLEDYKGIKGILRLSKEIRRKYDINLYIDLHNVLRSRLLEIFWRLNGIPAYVIDKGRKEKRKLTRKRNKMLVPLKSQHERYRETIARAGFKEISDTFKGIFNGRSKSDTSLFSDIVATKKDEYWVGVAPFAAHEGKIYPTDKMQEALDIVKRTCPGVKFFFFGGGDNEQTITEEWARRYPGSISLAGKRYGFAKEMALINHLDTMLTMDSANMHLAALASVPTVSIWGATHPYCGFRAWRQHDDDRYDDDTVQIQLPCRPCSVYGNRPCRHQNLLCLKGISPQSVASKILSTLNIK